MRNRADGNRRVADAIRYVCIRFLVFLAITGTGMGVMYFADNFRHMVAVGIVYLIAMCAIIVVILADQMDQEVRRILRGNLQSVRDPAKSGIQTLSARRG